MHRKQHSSSISRRQLLRSSAGLAALAAGAGLLTPLRAIADWPAGLLDQRNPDAGLTALLGGGRAKPHPDFVIDTADEAENGGQVQLTVHCPLGRVETLSLLLSKNPYPIAAVFHPADNWTGTVTSRVKLAASGRVTAIARAGGRTWRADKDIKVVAGGCA